MEPARVRSFHHIRQHFRLSQRKGAVSLYDRELSQGSEQATTTIMMVQKSMPTHFASLSPVASCAPLMNVRRPALPRSISGASSSVAPSTTSDVSAVCTATAPGGHSVVGADSMSPPSATVTATGAAVGGTDAARARPPVLRLVHLIAGPVLGQRRIF